MADSTNYNKAGLATIVSQRILLGVSVASFLIGIAVLGAAGVLVVETPSPPPEPGLVVVLVFFFLQPAMFWTLLGAVAFGTYRAVRIRLRPVDLIQQTLLLVAWLSFLHWIFWVGLMAIFIAINGLSAMPEAAFGIAALTIILSFPGGITFGIYHVIQGRRKPASADTIEFASRRNTTVIAVTGAIVLLVPFLIGIAFIKEWQVFVAL